MDAALKAALMSALVFPGVGQLYLKRPARALAFLLPALVAALYFGNQLYVRVALIKAQIEAGTMAFDPLAIAARLERDAPPTTLMRVAIGVILVCWVGATVDAWLIGRRNRPLVKA